MIRNVLMLAAGITNARHTGDLCNMTLEEFDRRSALESETSGPHCACALSQDGSIQTVQGELL